MSEDNRKGKLKIYVALGKNKNFLGWRRAKSGRRDYFDVVAESGMSIYEEPVYYFVEEGTQELIKVRD